jgi:hypothetical protein
LYLLTKDTGSKHWYFRYMLSGKHKDMSLGKYPTISLKLARTKADKARLLLSDSIDPMAQRKLLKLQSTCEDLNFAIGLVRNIVLTRVALSVIATLCTIRRIIIIPA